MPSEETVDQLARCVSRMADTIRRFYDDPAVQEAYQAWLKRKYGEVPIEQ